MSFRRGRPILLAIKPGGKGDIEKSHVTWELNKSIPEIPSPIFYDNIIYLIRNGGILAAIDAETGDQYYRERVNGSGQYTALLQSQLMVIYIWFQIEGKYQLLNLGKILSKYMVMK